MKTLSSCDLIFLRLKWDRKKVHIHFCHSLPIIFYTNPGRTYFYKVNVTKIRDLALDFLHLLERIIGYGTF